MKQLVTTAIILSRTDYGEADRILTLLTPEYGKLRVVAKGVRRIKSKLAGGIELFSVSNITFVKGRGEMGTLISTRLQKHYASIVQDLERTMTGYELIKRLNKQTEDHPEPEYFDILQQSFEALDDKQVPLALIQFWFDLQLLRLAGHSPNFQTDTQHARLSVDQLYRFDFDAMAFAPDTERGQYGVNHIKFLRLTLAGNSPQALWHIQGCGQLLQDCLPLHRILS